MANFLETSLTLAAFKDMVKESKGVEMDTDADLAEVADDVLSCDIEDHPTFYYFKGIGGISYLKGAKGKDYVVDQNGDTVIVSEVVEIDDETEFACREYLKHTVGSWDGEESYNLALYRVEPDFEMAEKGDKEVRVFARWNYYQNQSGAPANCYVSQYTATGEGDSDTSHIFDTYADAQAWIDNYYLSNIHSNGLYVLDHGQADAPTFFICK